MSFGRKERAPRHRVGFSKKTQVNAGGICERSGKRQFPSQRDAVRAAGLIKSMNPRKRRKALPVHVYQCLFASCRQWHLTRGPKEVIETDRDRPRAAKAADTIGGAK